MKLILLAFPTRRKQLEYHRLIEGMLGVKVVRVCGKWEMKRG